MSNTLVDKSAFYHSLIDELLKLEKPNSTKINSLKIKLAKEFKFNSVVKNPQILGFARDDDERVKLIEIFNTKPIREASGVTVVALFAKPHSCPHGKCMYCPGGPGSPFGDTPQSYTGHEPAAMRAKRNMYDPYLQIFNRLEHYVANGHDPDKLELIFMGGTFPSTDQEYRDEFVKYVYKAINDFGELFFEQKDGKRIIRYDLFNEFFEMTTDFSSQQRQINVQEKMFEQKIKNNELSMDGQIIKNETAIIRAIGLTVETKPDWALQSHCADMLRYGCTRLEIGVQTLNEDCLKRTNRGHDLQDTRDCFQVAKDMCFKINAHMMLGLPASNLETDEEGLVGLFEQEPYKPDMLKIYPCLVVEGTPLYNMYKMGKFEPIKTDKAAQIIARSYPKFPRWVRVMRVQRDIPTTLIERGVQKSNLRQYVEEEMKKLGVESKDIRAREIGIRQLQGFDTSDEFDISVEEFKASGGIDFFIDVVNKEDTMIGFIRLRFPYQHDLMPEIDEKTALIRELHIYGQTIPVGAESGASQHKGWGRKLVEKCEVISKERGYKKIAIISGVGVREYYKKLGYYKEGPYMCKKL